MIILTTNRLILRTWRETDIDPMTTINRDPRVCEFLPTIGDRASTLAIIKRSQEHYNKHGFSLYAVELKSTNELIGWTGLMIPSFEAYFTPAVEIGWRLAFAHWNQGYATEAAKSVLRYGFIDLNLDEIVSFTAVNNWASRCVMEKIGLHHDIKDDFNHPKLEKSHPLCRHVLYQLSKDKYLK
jgi:RimJ/RimL family protein N-acetyltransferase